MKAIGSYVTQNEAGERLAVFGWPSAEPDMRELHVSGGATCLVCSDHKIRSQGWVHAGSSGGPVVTTPISVTQCGCGGTCAMISASRLSSYAGRPCHLFAAFSNASIILHELKNPNSPGWAFAEAHGSGDGINMH